MGGDLYLQNQSGNTVTAKVNRVTKTIAISKTERFGMDSLFTTKVEIFYQNKKVASTTVKPSNKDLRFRIYRKSGVWLIEPVKYNSLQE